MTLLETIVRDLQDLPEPSLSQVARYVEGLHPRSRERRQKAIIETAGCLSGPEGEDFERAVRVESERIDRDEW